MPDNADLTDDYWALKGALDYASDAFERESSLGEDMADINSNLTAAYEALDAIKSRLGI